jgi:ferritin
MKPETLDNKAVNMLIERLQDEYDAFYLYRSISNWCKGVGFFKAAEFFAAESADELSHAKKIEDYLVDWNVMVDLPVIERPAINFESILDVIEQSYRKEYALFAAYEETSRQIMEVSLSAYDFLQEFRIKQRKAVAEYSDKLNILEGTKPQDKFQALMLEKKLF